MLNTSRCERPPDATGVVVAPLTADAPVDTTEAQVDTQLDEGMQVVKDEPTVEGNETEAAPAAEYIKIAHSHPMMGLWEGSFNVKSATGNDSIKGVIFFVIVYQERIQWPSPSSSILFSVLNCP